ncbi:MAG: polysaccharide deacetylase family protein [Povalibacter sp.]
MTICRADKVLLGGGAVMLGGSALFGVPTGLAVPAAAFAAVMLDGVFRPSSSTFYPTISNGPRAGNKIALTFDDGPDPEVTPTVLDQLGEAGARGTFFTIGRHLERHTDIGARAITEGHELGNHSWRHAYWQNFYTTSQHARDLERNARIIQSLTHSSQQPLYRPPVGLKSPGLARVAHARDLKIIAWSLHSRDTMSADANAIAQRVLKRVQPGEIVLMHDGHDLDGRHRRGIVPALPLILRGLNERGFECVTVSELLGNAAAS